MHVVKIIQLEIAKTLGMDSLGQGFATNPIEYIEPIPRKNLFDWFWAVRPSGVHKLLKKSNR